MGALWVLRAWSKQEVEEDGEGVVKVCHPIASLWKYQLTNVQQAQVHLDPHRHPHHQYPDLPPDVHHHHRHPFLLLRRQSPACRLLPGILLPTAERDLERVIPRLRALHVRQPRPHYPGGVELPDHERAGVDVSGGACAEVVSGGGCGVAADDAGDGVAGDYGGAVGLDCCEGVENEAGRQDADAVEVRDDGRYSAANNRGERPLDESQRLVKHS